MRELSIYVLLFLVTACSNGQDIKVANLDGFYFNSKKLSLISDTIASKDNYIVNRINESGKIRVKFNNIPSNIVKMEDEFGDEFTYLDSTSIYDINYIDTIQNIEDLRIKYIVGDEAIDTMSFRYEVLSEKKRISSKGLNRILTSELPELLKKDIEEDRDVSIIIYGFSFYQGENLYSVGGGRLCVVLKK